jgi:hypothetical protein
MACLFCSGREDTGAERAQDGEEAKRLARRLVKMLLASDQVELKKRYPWMADTVTKG